MQVCDVQYCNLKVLYVCLERGGRALLQCVVMEGTERGSVDVSDVSVWSFVCSFFYSSSSLTLSVDVL